MDSFIRRVGHSIKSSATAKNRKIQIAWSILRGRSAIGVIVGNGSYKKFDYFKDLSLTEGMTMIVALKKQTQILETHIDQAANIQGEQATLEALRNTVDTVNGHKQ
jgi:hypothetical protein